MRFLWDLAVKNLFRNKLRTFVSILAIVLSVALVVFVKGLVMGFVDNMYQLHIQYQAGHIRIIDQEYRRKERLLSLVCPVDGFDGAGISRMKVELNNIEGVKRVIPRIKFGAVVSSHDEMVRMMGLGVEANKEIQFTDIKNQIVEGRMIKEGRREVVMGVDLLDKLDLDVGEKVTFLYQTSFGSFKGSTFKVVGKIDSGLKLLDRDLFYLPLVQAQRILELPDMATEILIETANYREVNSIIPKVNDLFKDKEVEGRYFISAWDRGYDMISMLKVAEGIYNFIYIFLVLLAGFVVINTMVMIVKERRKEIGMMTALGLKGREIMYMFIIEGIIMGLIGSLIGVIAGGIITKATAITGIIDYSKAMEGVSSKIMMNPVIRPVVNVENLIYAFVLGVIVTGLTCIIPARSTAQLNPVEALRDSN